MTKLSRLLIVLLCIGISLSGCKKVETGQEVQNNSEEKDKKEPSKSIDQWIDILTYVGDWHDDQGIGAGYGERYRFMEDGTFIYGSNQANDQNSMRYQGGFWSIQGTTLILEIDHKVMYEDDKINRIWLAEKEIINHEITSVEDTEEGSLRDKRFYIDGNQFWLFEEDIFEEYPRSDSSVNIKGIWKRTNVWRMMPAQIEIVQQDSRGFHFNFDGSYSYNIGSLNGYATFVDTYTAIYPVYDYQDTYQGDMKFIWRTEDELEVSFDGDVFSLGLGMNVTVDGTYILGIPEYIQNTGLKTALPDDVSKNHMKELLGEDYQVLEEIAEEALERSEPYQYDGFISGIGYFARFSIEKNGNIYCLLRGESWTVKFYTNDEAWEQNAPQPFLDRINEDKENIEITVKSLEEDAN